MLILPGLLIGLANFIYFCVSCCCLFDWIQKIPRNNQAPANIANANLANQKPNELVLVIEQQRKQIQELETKLGVL